MFEDQRWEEVHIWFEGIYLEKYLMWECFERTKPPFFDVIQNIDKNKIRSFFEQIQSHFQSSFLECKFLNAKYQLFRALINCDSKTALSKTFIESLETLERKLNTDSNKAYLLPETHIIHKEHQLFADLVNKFTADKHDIISLKLLIQKLYKNSTIIFRENGEKVFEIAGRQIIWSNVSETCNKNFGQDSISQLRLTARHMLVLDANIKYDGKNLSLISPKIVVQFLVTCDLSGRDAVEIVSAKAGNGNAKNKNGENGINGFDGASSGSIVICASEIVNPENLNIVMNGGQGSKGQDGGDGFDGENGVGKKFKKAFGFGAKIKLKTTAIGNVILGGLPGILRARYNEKEKENGLKRLKSFSTHKWPSHAMVVYKGTKGSPGAAEALMVLADMVVKKAALQF
uniref:Uncharacterized protein n=1 Tax=Panagrolaimus davidi TaxID=227884 RepID=A0A914QX16_9BILA